MEQQKEKTLEKTAQQKDLPTIISARTGLTPVSDAIMKTLPKTYAKTTVREALNYLLQQKGLHDDEIALARSIKKEMEADDFVIVINGKNANLSDKISDYTVRKEHKLPNQQVKPYNSLEIEVSAVQEGGLYRK